MLIFATWSLVDSIRCAFLFSAFANTLLGWWWELLSLDCFGHLNNSNFQTSWTWDECLSVGIISSSFYPYMDFSFFKITTVFIIVKIANDLNACPSVSGWLNNPQPWNILAPIRKTWVSSAKSWRERGSRARIPQNGHYWAIYWPECGPRQQLGLDKRHIYRSVCKWFHPNWNVLGLTRSRGHPWYQCPIVKISLNSFVCLWFTRQLWQKKMEQGSSGGNHSGYDSAQLRSC